MAYGKFQYSPAMNAVLESVISSARLAPYLAAASGDLQNALDLYVWNIGASAALFGPLQVLEIAFRNAMDRELRALCGPSWHSGAAFASIAASVRGRARRAPDLLFGVRSARKVLIRAFRSAHPRAVALPQFTTDQIVAAMTFGSWTTMLGPSFEPDLWAPALRRAFPNYSSVAHAKFSRPPIAARFEDLRVLRNRVMHHEPLIKRTSLVSDFDHIVEASAWISRETAEWIQHHARFRDVLSVRERPRHAF
jgi:hypothetical protein